jgi:predicted regulator of Ras-like GTPase activity (Roadblock/LC7/MglB family)
MTNKVGHENGGGLKLILKEMIGSSGALTSLLLTKQGIPVADAGDTSYLNVTAMGALVAGMFSATHEVARMVGENHFSILLQQGEIRHIHISLVDDSHMMVVIFEELMRIGLVRHEAKNAGIKLARALMDRSGGMDAPQISTPRFRELALNLIDRIFETK